MHHEHSDTPGLFQKYIIAKAVYPLLAPGTTMMVTDAAVLESTAGTMLAVVTNEPPPAKP